MAWTRKVAGILMILSGLYLLYSSLTTMSAEPTSAVFFYLTVFFSVVWTGFGALLLFTKRFSLP
jgi:hypothetical protein